MRQRTIGAALHERRVAPRVARHNGRGGLIYDATATKKMATAVVVQADSRALLERHLTVPSDNKLLHIMGPESSWAHARYQISHAMPIQWTVRYCYANHNAHSALFDSMCRRKFILREEFIRQD